MMLMAAAAAAAVMLGCHACPLAAATAPGGRLLVGTAPQRCHDRTDISYEARQLCSGALVTDSLRLVGLGENSGTDEEQAATVALLGKHGFRTARDLWLLDSAGAEAVELMEQLRLGGISIGARSKLRLLLGDPRHQSTGSGGGDARPAADTSCATNASRRFALRRQLQDGSGGMSADTIAIVLSVMVGAVGYLIQAYTARRAEHSLAEQTREQHTLEVVQQRDHERMMAQIARTDRAVDDCCSPVLRLLNSYVLARCRFVAANFVSLEVNRPETLAELYALGEYKMRSLELDAGGDGPVRFAGQVLLDPTKPQGNTWAAPTVNSSFFVGTSEARVVDMSLQDLLTFFTKPYVRELPESLFKLMAADLEGALAEGYREYIRYEVKPVLSRFASIVHEHLAAIQPPPLEWLIEKFPGHNSADSTLTIVAAAVAYSRALDRMVAGWDGGKLDTLQPPQHMMPLMAVKEFFDYSRKRGEAKQEELIGMSSGRLDASSIRAITAADGG